MRRFTQDGSPPDEKCGVYRKITEVPMWGPMLEEFACESREGTLHGQIGDFLAKDGHGGFYPISAKFHADNYELA